MNVTVFWCLILISIDFYLYWWNSRRKRWRGFQKIVTKWILELKSNTIYITSFCRPKNLWVMPPWDNKKRWAHLSQLHSFIEKINPWSCQYALSFDKRVKDYSSLRSCNGVRWLLTVMFNIHRICCDKKPTSELGGEQKNNH